jgi:site-specific recombinase XerD
MKNEKIFKELIERRHIALVKAWLQGVDLENVGERYLTEIARETGKTDLRTVKSVALRAVLDLGGLARRHGINKGVSRLVKLAKRIRKTPDGNLLSNLEEIPEDSDRPSFEEYKSTLADVDAFSDAELLASYNDKYPAPPTQEKAAPAAREKAWLNELLVLISQLEKLTQKQIAWQDPVGDWFVESLADHMTNAKINTLLDLATAITNRPKDWYLDLPGIGQTKATQIESFARDRLGDYEKAVRAKGLVLPPTPAAISSGLWLHAEDLTAPITNLEHPTRQMLSGEHGRLRSQDGQSALEAINDYEAMKQWLELKSSPATIKLYEREITRLIAWSIQIRRRALSSLSLEDALAYRDFLSNVPAHLLVPKGPRPKSDHPELMRAAGFAHSSLKPSSIKKSLVIINGFYAWLVKQNHIVANPFTGVKPPTLLLGTLQESTEAADESGLELARQHKESAVDRTLPQEAIDAIENYLNGPHQDKDEPFVARSRFLFWFGTMTGLRISEMALARFDHLEFHSSPSGKGGYWDLAVIGKKGKPRQVPFPTRLMRELEIYLEHRGLIGTQASITELPKGTYLIGGFPLSTRGKLKGDGVRPQTIHRALKELFALALRSSELRDPKAAGRLRKATTHWLRHTSATDAVARGVPLDIVSDNLGHSDLKTTSIYVQAERQRKMEETEKLWQ